MDQVDVVESVLTREGMAHCRDVLHNWRCAYPERYGRCRCVRDLAELVVAELATFDWPVATRV